MNGAKEAPQINSPPHPEAGLLSKSKTIDKEWNTEAGEWMADMVPYAEPLFLLCDFGSVKALARNDAHVIAVLSDIPHRYQEHADSPVPFFHLLERLKTTKRAGWRRFGIDHGESISDHMYRMSILTMLAPASLSSKLDIPRCTKMALVHDMAESLVGDITPADNIEKSEKSRRETETMDYISNNLLSKYNGGLSGADLRTIWQEYEDSETLESKFVHDIDKMELLLQMVEYERFQEGGKDLGEFAHVYAKIELPEIQEWGRQVLRERAEFWQSIGKEVFWPDGLKPDI